MRGMVLLDMARVYALFSLFSDLEGMAAEPWRGFCDTAAGLVHTRLRPGVDEAEHGELLCTVSAALAYADYLAVQAMGGRASELRVGDITVKESGRERGGDADGIRGHFLGMAAHLLVPECPALLTAGGQR